MYLLLVAIGILCLSGLVASAVGRSSRWATACGAGGVVVAALIGIVPSVAAVLGATPQSIRLAWSVPYGAFFVEVDALSGFFLVVIFTVCPIAAVWGSAYLLQHHGKKSLGPPWFFFNVLIASMALVVVARNGVLFLVAWEVMALASFFLVTFDDDDEGVRDAGWIYLVATHLGTAFLLVLFLLLGEHASSLDFDRFLASPERASVLFLLAVCGFGTKAGLLPFHVWLPEAHSAAPSHVSAVMSGVMIKIGIYGLIRMLTILGPPPAWWGWLLVAAGLSSGIYGVVFALAQHDLKRLLAYSSVENVGIIVLGLGVGVVGLDAGQPTVATLGFAGALLHILNHALFKGLLFLGVGAVAHSTGTRELDQLGGLLKRMPVTGAAFVVGAVAIAALPPLNGFVGEWLIYFAAFNGIAAPGRDTATAVLSAIGGLALIGGLVAAGFTKVFGIVFLGEPRSRSAERAAEPALVMRAAMLALAAGCVFVGCFAPVVVAALVPVVRVATGLPADAVAQHLGEASRLLRWFVAAAAALVATSVLILFLRRWLLSRRDVGAAPTWDCGYAAPTPRMQYTSSSFSQPLTELFTFLLQTRHRGSALKGLLPDPTALATAAPDLLADGMYRPLFDLLGRGLRSVRWVQHGRVHVYVLYIAITLLVLLVWKLG
ncbi:MAG: hypothetical protein HY270_17335 [Deltaproteobacteria bacterium]|nr:hypothetical protein [Deltaproteobacteria bacterium]